MKNLKTILAWLDWSSYAGSYEYSRPKTLCPLFWRSLFSILFLPITYPVHLFNLAISDGEFRREYGDPSKLNWMGGGFMHFLVAFVGLALLKSTTDGSLGWDWLYVSDPLWITYLKLLGAGISGCIIFLIFIAAIAGIWHSVKYVFTEIKHKIKPVSSAVKETEPGALTKIYRAIKDKYCPIIDWSEVESNQ